VSQQTTVMARAELPSPGAPNNLFQDQWSACFEINFSDTQEDSTVSSIICDQLWALLTLKLWLHGTEVSFIIYYD